jgi:hypothetical protein
MLNILTHAMLYSYIEANVSGVPESMVKIAQCEIDRAIVQRREDQLGPMPIGGSYPYYIAKSFGEKIDLEGDNPWNGMEHAIDVASVISLGAVFANTQTQRQSFYSVIYELIKTHEVSAEAWTRYTDGRPKYRLAPHRKYNWQYRHLGTIGWALNKQ